MTIIDCWYLHYKTRENVIVNGKKIGTKIKNSSVGKYRHYGKTFHTNYKYTPPPYFINNRELPKIPIPDFVNSKLFMSTDCDYNGKKNYCGEFNTFTEMLNFVNDLEEKDKNKYEIIPRFKPQKIKIDVDFNFFDKEGNSVSTKSQRSFKFKKFIIETIHNVILETFAECFGVMSLFGQDLYTYDSSTNTKHSFHVVLQNYHVKDAIQAKIFCMKMKNKLLDIKNSTFSDIVDIREKKKKTTNDIRLLEKYKQVGETIDLKVYGEFQNFRMINCCKSGKNNFKKPCKFEINGYTQNVNEMKDLDSLVGYIPRSSILLKDLIDVKKFSDDSTRPINVKEKKGKNTGFNHEYADDEELNQIENMVEDKFPNTYFFSNTQGPYICFKRANSAYCEICKRTHDSDGVFCILLNNGKVLFYCRRDENSKSVTLGTIKRTNNILLDQNEDDYEKVIPKRVFDIPEENKLIIENIKRYIGDLPEGNLIISGYLGCGKTTALEPIIKEAKRVLILSPRINYANAISVRVDIPCYNDPEFRNCIDQLDKIVLSMESLWKLFGNYKFDLVIIDEVTSCLNQFISPHMKSHLQDNINMFELILKNCGRVVFADAFILQDTINLCKDLGINYSFYNHITEPEQKRICIEIPMKQDKDNKKIYSLEPLFKKMIDLLKLGYKIYFVCVSKTKLLEFEELLKKTFPNKHYNSFYSDAKDDKKIYRDVDKHWTNKIEEVEELIGDILFQYEIVLGEIICTMTTMTNTVGLNYTLEYYDYLFVYGGPGSGPVRDLFQSSMRVRHIKSNTMYFSLHPQEICEKPYFCKEEFIKLNYDNIEEWWEEIAKEFDIKLKTKQSPWVEKLFVFKTLEKYNSQQHYRKMFEHYLEFCHYEKPIIEEVLDIEDIEIVKVSEASYSEIPDPEYGSIKPYEKRKNDKIADEEDKRIIKKNLFNLNFIDFDNDEIEKEIASLFDQCYVSKNKKIISHLVNVRYELTGFNSLKYNNSFRDTLSNEKERVTFDKRILFLKSIEDICNHFGMESSFEEVTIERNLIETLEKNLYSNQLIKDLELRKQGNDKEKDEFKDKILNLNILFGNWCDGHFEMKGKQKRERINGKRETINDYIYKPNGNFKKLKKYLKKLNSTNIKC